MNVVELGIDEIRPYEKNPRINDGAVDAVIESISAYGWKVPIVVDAEGVIVTGEVFDLYDEDSSPLNGNDKGVTYELVLKSSSKERLLKVKDMWEGGQFA